MIERHSTSTRQSTRAVPTRCRRGADAVPSRYGRTFHGIFEGVLVSRRGFRCVCVCLCASACACNERVRVHGFVCVCASVCVVNGRVRTCVRPGACARVRARVSVRACLCDVRCVFESPPDCIFSACVCWTCVRSERVCAARRCARTLVARAATCGIYSSARAVRCGRARVVAFGAIGRVSRALAAGVNWTCRTASAGWAGRWGHTSVVDAAGAIYVIGGYAGGIVFHDVWASADGGARAGLRRWGQVGEVLEGVLHGGGGTRGVVEGYPRGFAPGRPTRSRISDLHPCRSPSVAAHVNAAADAIILHVRHAWPSARNVCALIRAVARARVSAHARVC
jgi:hypothetical protein